MKNKLFQFSKINELACKTLWGEQVQEASNNTNPHCKALTYMLTKQTLTFSTSDVTVSEQERYTSVGKHIFCQLI